MSSGRQEPEGVLNPEEPVRDTEEQLLEIEDEPVLDAEVQLVDSVVEPDAVIVERLEDTNVAPSTPSRNPPLQMLSFLSSISSMSSEGDEKKSVLFSRMADHPWPFLFALPILYIIFIGLGYSTDNKIEESVGNLWIAENGDFAKDQAYAARYGMNELDASSFAAMAVARDGKNIMTETRLEEIRARMELAEGTTVGVSRLSASELFERFLF